MYFGEAWSPTLQILLLIKYLILLYAWKVKKTIINIALVFIKQGKIGKNKQTGKKVIPKEELE